MLSFLEYLQESDPCWKGYKQLGMKKKNGKTVPNCVPANEELDEAIDKEHPIYKEYEALKKHDVKTLRGMVQNTKRVVDVSGFDKAGAITHLLRSKHGNKKVAAAFGLSEDKETIDEATYKGKEVTLNKPMKGDVKKSKVYVDPDGDGKAQKVNFGDKNLSIKKHIKNRKDSYCARSAGQGNTNNKTSANYWSRKAWDC